MKSKLSGTVLARLWPQRISIISEGNFRMPNLSTTRRNTKLFIIGLALIFAALSFFNRKASASASGPSPSFTNAPGEDNCTACHTSFAVNSGGGNEVITGLPTNYLPNQMIPITVTVNHMDAVIYGFELTAVDSLGRNAGTLIEASPQLQIVQGIVGGNIRDYIEHTLEGTAPTQFHTKSWSFTWRAPATRVGKITLYAGGNGANSDGGPNGDYIYTTSSSTYSNSAPSNFDGDGKTDLAVFRPTDGNWYITRSSNGAFSGQQFGASGDKPIPGDFDGDGKHDLAVFRPSSGTWYIIRSSNGAFSAEGFGANGDVPVVGDFDGDGKSDLAVFRPSEGTWYIKRSSNGTLQVAQFGANGDKPVPGDYNADARTDVAVYRPSTGTWYMLLSPSGTFSATQFGVDTDKPVPGDYDGDGKTDIAVWRPSNGTWYIQASTAGFSGQGFGISTDRPAPGDFDGDGKTDVAVFRDGTWYAMRSSNGSLFTAQFGQSGDVPAPAAYIPE
jgi:hypothetical protein